MGGGKGNKSNSRGSSKKSYRARGGHAGRSGGRNLVGSRWDGAEKPDSVIDNDAEIGDVDLNGAYHLRGAV